MTADDEAAAAYRAKSANRRAYRALVDLAMAGDDDAAEALAGRWAPLVRAGFIRTGGEEHEQADASERQVFNL